ncbi:unnamed protein product [Vitrella brassicaformis CCMP3155]|uniref:ZP domain-containing protein n=3 Tax=Vitrella brassicaformis TaxID=1169539 RepID=A0A0G4FAV0_VITBC|nr:unnamed protein product [Vitrella brassicaformis CCMP3155]|eukprot:CEM09749.1 unnamed protein product [Vitrella brassicaformis CCMP3155]
MHYLPFVAVSLLISVHARSYAYSDRGNDESPPATATGARRLDKGAVEAASAHPDGRQPTAAEKEAGKGKTEKWSVSDWLKKKGVPKGFPPVAWCTDKRMTAAVAVASDPALSGARRGGFRNSTADPDCGATFAEDFFSPAHALIASVDFSAWPGKCGMATSESDRYVYHTNVLRVYGASNNAVVTCACHKETGQCHPTARWESSTQALIAFDGNKTLATEMKAVAQGHMLSSGLLAGENMTIHIPNDDDSFVFESSVVGSDFHPWPMLCDALCPEGYQSTDPACVHHLVVNGCPVSDELDFRVRVQDPGRIVFSMKPMSLHGHDSIKVQCMMTAFAQKTSVDEQCRFSKTALKRRRRLQTWNDTDAGAVQKPAVVTSLPTSGEVEGQGLLPTALGTVAQNPWARAGTQTLITEVSNEIVYDNWSVQWGRDIEAGGDTAVQVGNDLAFVGVGVGKKEREVSVNAGVGKFAISYSSDESDAEAGAGVAYGAYSVRVDQDADDRQTAVEVVARGVETGTNVDILDRDYGQRVKVRNTEVAVRHDFNDFDDPTTDDDEELATEVFAGYKSVAVAVGQDVQDTEYAVSVGVLGYQFSVLRDFDERETDFQGNWGDGYQLVLNGDFPDPANTEVFIQVGFGVLGVTYVQVGAGVGGDGIPQGSAEVETEDFGLGFDFIDDLGDRLFLYSITVGKFTYVWESEVVPEGLKIPLILGAGPL